MSFDKHHVKKPTMGLPARMGTFAKNGESFSFEVNEDTIAEALQANMNKRPETVQTIRAAAKADVAAIAAACDACAKQPMMAADKLAPWATR
eukprot:432775-Pleurochrysis_carterae.AAC.1